MTTSLLVVRLGSLGDLVHTLPAVSAIRRAHPGARDRLARRCRPREFLALVPVITSSSRFDDRTARGWLEARRELRARQYDVALDFQGLIKSAALARLSGARRVIGFDRGVAARAGGGAVLHRARRGRARAGTSSRRTCGSPRSSARARTRSSFRSADVDVAALATFARSGLGPFALLNCGAAWPNKRWPPDRFGRVGRWLRERHGLRQSSLWGPGEAADR